MVRGVVSLVGLAAIAIGIGACASGGRVAGTCPETGAVGARNGPSCTNQSCHLNTATRAKVSVVDQKSRDALLAALDDERRAEAYYGAVLDRFGQVRPFSQIINAERRHEAHVLTLMKNHGVDAPANRWANEKPEVPSTLADAARQAVEFERQNVAMYDGFLEFVPAGDIRDTMAQMRKVSLERHIPAFEAAAKRSS